MTLHKLSVQSIVPLLPESNMFPKHGKRVEAVTGGGTPAGNSLKPNLHAEACMLECEENGLNTAVQEEYMQIEIALDSGAGDHVVDDLDAPGYAIEESRGSRNGSHFIGAGGEKIENKG